jgi:hypothetical protein
MWEVVNVCRKKERHDVKHCDLSLISITVLHFRCSSVTLTFHCGTAVVKVVDLVRRTVRRPVILKRDELLSGILGQCC